MQKPEQCLTWGSIPCTPQTTALSFSFSLEHGSSLHKSQRPTGLKPSQIFFILPWSQVRNQNLSLVLASFRLITHAPHRSMMSTSTSTNNLASLDSARYVYTTESLPDSQLDKGKYENEYLQSGANQMYLNNGHYAICNCLVIVNILLLSNYPQWICCIAMTNYTNTYA